MNKATGLLGEAPLYAQYVYSYPHKLAYGPIEPAHPLDELWQPEPKGALFAYVHLPFCEQRCGFCNLFTFANPRAELPSRYVDALARQTQIVRAALGGEARFARFAIGGGTPTYLDPRELARMFDVTLGALGCEAGGSVETSPETATAERLDVLRERGVTRVSMGVQSFLGDETAAIERRQSSAVVHAAIERIRARGFACLNLDLMYGLPGQTRASFLASIDAALEHAPEEIYLYPLYVRRLTILGRRAEKSERVSWDEERLALYRAGRERLFERGYRAVSMRMFRRNDAPGEGGSAYRCQRDGMVGLGCGARSYTHAVHYATPYAVGAEKVRAILEAWVEAPDSEHATARWGYVLDEEEQRRRFAILSLLHEDGLDRAAYRERFGAEVETQLPELAAILSGDGADTFARDEGGVVRLTAAGLERSDQLGPLLMSAAVRARIEAGPRE